MSLLSLLMLGICVFSLSCTLCLCVCLCLWLSLFPPHVYGSVLIFLTSKQLITRGGLSANLWISISVQVSLLGGSSCSRVADKGHKLSDQCSSTWVCSPSITLQSAAILACPNSAQLITPACAKCPCLVNQSLPLMFSLSISCH